MISRLADIRPKRALQLAMSLDTEAFLEADPVRKALYKEAVDALQHKLPRGRRPSGAGRVETATADKISRAKQLAASLRTEALESDPDRRSLLEAAADALEHKLRRGRSINPHLRRLDDIIFVERYHALKTALKQSGSKKAATRAFEQLAVEYELADGETARRIYHRAVKRSRLGPTGT
jgi:hypothetical protein